MTDKQQSPTTGRELCVCGHALSAHPFDRDDLYEDGHCIHCDCPPYGFKFALSTTQRKHVVEGAFAETPNGARLLGSRCAGCGACFFPRSAACRNPGCSDKRIEDVELSPRGTLWSYTVQYYRPPPPARLDDPFTPYGIGLVDLPEGIRIMGMISSDDPGSLRIGQEMELVIETLHHDDDGSEVLTWKFRPL